jgi:photosystem II stability/assembly factor-like uncharacterized protein
MLARLQTFRGDGLMAAPRMFLALALMLLPGSALAEAALPAETGSAAPVPPRPADIMPQAEHALVLDAAAAGDALVAVGVRGHILVKRAGTGWEQRPAPHDAMLTGIAVSPDGGTALAAGHDATILRTSDGGDSWELVHFAPGIGPPSSFMDVAFISNGRALAVGTYGLSMASADGGRSWEDIPIAAEDEFGQVVHLNAIMNDGAGNVLVAGEFGEIYRSADGGESFAKLETSPYDGSFFGGLALGEGDFMAFGLEGVIFRSRDSGETWDEAVSGAEVSLQGGLRAKDGTIYITGLSGTVLTSTDGGESFTAETRPDRLALAGMAEAPDGALFLLSEKGLLPYEVQE